MTPPEPPVRDARASVLVAFALVLVALVLHARQVAGEVLVYRDSHLFYAPAKKYLAEVLGAGELPQWWPWDATGGPFLAQPMFSVFHPTTLLYAVLPWNVAFAGQDVVATIAALIGAAAFARTVGVSRPAAFLTGALYGTAGYLVCLTEHTYMKLSAATLPWYLAAVGLAVARGGRWVAAPGLAMGLLLLGGDPQIGLLAAGAGLVWALVLPGGRRCALAIGIGSPLVGGLLASPQLLPSLLVVPESSRALAMAEADRWPFGLAELFGVLVPIDLGTAAFASSTYLGVGALALAAAALGDSRRTVRAMWGLVGVSLWLAAGEALGLNSLLREVVPLWGRLRYPIKSSVLAFLLLPVLAGIGFDRLAAPRSGPRALLPSIGVLLVGVVALVVVDLPLLERLTVLTVAVGALGAAVVGGSMRWVGAVLVAIGGLSTGLPWLRTAPDSFFDPPPLAEALASRVGLTGPAYDRIDPDYAASQRAVRSTGCDDTCMNGMFGLPSVSAYMPGAPLRVRQLFEAAADGRDNAKLLGVLGARYVIVTETIQSEARFPEIARDPARGLVLVELSRWLARAHAIHRAVPVRDASEARARFFSPAFKPGREVIIEADVAPDVTRRPDRPAVPLDIRAIDRTNASLAVDAELPWDGFVVLNEAWASGWRASVDGVEVPLLVANGAVRAVEVPAGMHRIEFRFETPGLRTGLWLALVGLLIAVAAGLVGTRRARVDATGRAA